MVLIVGSRASKGNTENAAMLANASFFWLFVCVFATNTKTARKPSYLTAVAAPGNLQICSVLANLIYINF